MSPGTLKRLDEVVAFYRDGIGLTEIGAFRDHDGYDGAFLAVAGTGAHLELSASGGHGARRRIRNRYSCSTSATIRPVQAVAARLGVDPIPRQPVLAGAWADVPGPGRLPRVVPCPKAGRASRRTDLDLDDVPSHGLMTVTIDDELYVRGTATLLASWEEYARASAGAALKRLDGVSAAVFPSDPERGVYNNALLDRDLGPTERAAAADAMEAAYRSAGVDRYAAWVHESDEGMRADLGSRGFTIEESTRAMGMPLDDVSPVPSHGEIGPLGWADYVGYLEIAGAPAGLLSGADPSAFHLLAAQLAGETVATALAFDHDGDCGVYNMSTLEAARRRGLGTALTARHLHDAVERGCSTASLQSTPIAERVYAAVGFRDLGRFLEYMP